jgi:hypothetical protein
LTKVLEFNILKITMVKIKKLLFIFSFLFIATSLLSPVYAELIPLTGNEEEFQCGTDEDCQNKYGAGACKNSVCMVETYGEIEDQLADCHNSKEMNLSCYIIGTDKLGLPDGFTGQGDTYLNFWQKTLSGTKFQDPVSGKIITKGGATQTVTNLVASLYSNPPASSVEYLADLGGSLGLVSPAYAQNGVGFTSLRPILEIWKLFRNVAYVFFVLVFLVIGLFIMFRVKIDPKTVISIQNAIPRIVIALLLVTFSYAIAGLLIDLVYVVTSVGIAVIRPPGSQSALLGVWNFFINGVTEIPGRAGIDVSEVRQALTLGEFNNPNPNTIQFTALFWGVSNNITHAVTGILNPFATLLDVFHAPRPLINTVNSLYPLSNIVSIVINIILIFTFFRLFLALLRAYVSILVNIVFGPLRIMLGAIPGVEGFGGWFRDLVSNLAVFPAVLLVLAVASKIINLKVSEPLWGPPMIHLPGQAVWGVGNIIGNWVPGLIGLGMLLLTARIPEIIQSFFAKKPFAYGTAIGEALVPGPVKFVGGIGKDAVKKGVVGYAEPEITTFIGNLRRGRQETGTAGATARAGNPPTG